MSDDSRVLGKLLEYTILLKERADTTNELLRDIRDSLGKILERLDDDDDGE